MSFITHVWSTCHLVNVFVAPFAPFLGYSYVVVFILEVVVSATGGADVGWLLGQALDAAPSGDCTLY